MTIPALRHYFLIMILALAGTADGVATEEKPSKQLEQLWQQYYDDDGSDEARERRIIAKLISESQRLNSKYDESRARWQLMVFHYNHAHNDSVIIEAPAQMEFYKARKEWNRYYETWTMVVNTYSFSNHVTRAIRETEKMYRDAQKRDNVFGMTKSNYTLGMTYMNIRNNEEAAKAFERCLKHTIDDYQTISQIYFYYCSALNNIGDYQKLLRATDKYMAAINEHNRHGKKSGEELRNNADWTECNIYRAQALTGLKRYKEAQALIDDMMQRSDNMKAYALHHLLSAAAGQALQTKETAKAIAYNDRMLKTANDIGDEMLIHGAESERVDILMSAGRYEEAARLLQKLHKHTIESNNADMQHELTEMNTIFRLDELRMESNIQRARFIAGTIALVAVALLLILYFRYRASKRLKKAYHDLQIANSKAEESSRMKTSFIQQISHEIRTPLNILSGFTQIITANDIHLDSEMRHDISKQIMTNTDRITELVNKMLELADINSQKAIEQNDDVTALEIAAQAVEDSLIAQTPHLTFSMNAEPEAETVMLHTNRHCTVRVLSLLLDNAKKFTKEGDSAVLRIDSDNENIRFTVENSGISIPETEAEHIFEEFVQLDNYKEGTGIGLTVARSIAQRLGGDVTLDTTFTNGAKFIFTLPK